MRWIGRIFIFLISLGFLGLILGGAAAGFILHHYSRDIPDYSQLKDYEPPIVTRIYAGDGNLLAEYAQERRIFMPIHTIPAMVKHAFIAAEDQNFYTHRGVDFMAVARAMVTNVKNRGSGRRLIGASTITQQVAKNFLLTNEVSYERKIKEAILSFRIDKAMTKDQILELYMNEIFLGQRAYGVAAAALTYFNKPLDDLTISEAAYLAALPKAPNNYHPVRQRDAAIARRNWVIGRMVEDGYITAGQAELAISSPLINTDMKTQEVDAPYFAEEVRREIEKKYGPESLYKGGLAVRTSVDPRLQNIAQQTLRQGLMDYDRRYGWRGPVTQITDMGDAWNEKLKSVKAPDDMISPWQLAVVIRAYDDRANLGFIDGTQKNILLEQVTWARKSGQKEISSVRQVMDKGDVVMVEEVGGKLMLRQIPKIQGALVALDPHTGRVLAMQGGWKAGVSSFNRATQAQRQPGSAFKPFIYLAALDKGFTPAKRVLDAPFTLEQAPGQFWSPENYSGEFYGPTPIRVGMEKSRNLMTVRLADHIGMDTVVEYTKKFGIMDDMKPFLSNALGAGETTLMRLTTAYGMIVNGGKKITPTFIDRVQDRRGKTIFSDDTRPCPNCGPLIRWDGQNVPDVVDQREQIQDPRTAYQMVSILEGVIQRGTARALSELGLTLGGKTGTTNDSKDTWFIGFSPDLVVGVFVGFDDPKSMGEKETGASVSAPIFGAFMKQALGDEPPMPFRIPPGIKLVRINAATGRTAMPGDSNVIWESFVTGTEPNLDDYVLDTGVVTGLGESYMPYGASPDDAPYDPNNAYPPADTPVYQDGQVETYRPDDPFTSFSRPSNDLPDQTMPAPPPAIEPDPTLTGTGALY
ncbi:MAG: penicillin-binding protein 1A [Alphaproteobacteria bacterium]|nr:penicillin-binding protein 1A [Alphaproteobacteria bacterium]